MRDVAAALAYCHWQGVVHGDVKPDNMLAGADGRVRLIDFSVSQMLPNADGAEDGAQGGELSSRNGGAQADVVARTPGAHSTD